MRQVASMLAFAALLTFGLGNALVYAGDPAPAPTEQKDKKDTSSGKLYGDEKKDEKKDMGGK
ncbi:MAG: hypothetical protein ACT4OO_15105 [Nitrospiraceae bacterium]